MDNIEFCNYLEETLIPDLRESGKHETASDFESAAKRIRHLQAKANPEPPEKYGRPPALKDYIAANFQTMLDAADDGALCLVSAVHAESQEPAALVCAMNQGMEDGVEFFYPAPVAVMLDENPYETYENPVESYGDGEKNVDDLEAGDRLRGKTSRCLDGNGLS
jgi:hypothetical protein